MMPEDALSQVLDANNYLLETQDGAPRASAIAILERYRRLTHSADVCQNGN